MSGRKTEKKSKKAKAKIYKANNRLFCININLTTKIIKDKKKNIKPLEEY
jgi:hypothetical protein